MKGMNILYSIDEWKKDYSRYLWVSILSLLEKNKNEDIRIYILSEYIEEWNKEELIRIVKEYWKKIYFSEWQIIPESFKKILGLKWLQPMATYYRFFFRDKFPIKDRILYLDCDTIVNRNLSEFYNSDFEWNVFIWDIDLPISVYLYNKNYWLNNYINAWVILINAELFCIDDLFNWIIQYNQKFGIPEHNDQDYLNYIYSNKIKLYTNLQYIVFYKWQKLDYSDCLIIHTIKKPNSWWHTFCPKKIENLFDTYLSKTKWEVYIWWRKKKSIKENLWYYCDYVLQFFVYITIRIFWARYAYRVDKFLYWLMRFLCCLVKKIF